MSVEITPDHVKAMCQRNLALYASEYLRGPDKAPYHGQFLIADHHEEWAQLVNDHSRLCLQAARDHGKSHMFTLAYPLWKAEQHPGEYGFIFSASQPQAEKILLKIIDEVETNPKLQHLRPQAGGRSRKWSAQCAQFANGFTIYARGYGTKVRGAHPIFIVVDDGLNDESAFSERVRTRDIDYFQSAITNMIVPGGQIVVIGTPLHKKDLYAILEENTEYAFARYPAIIEDGEKKGLPLWPERYDSESLAKRKREIGSIKFSREFLCRVVTDGSSLFPKVLFQGDKTEQYNVRLGMPLRFWHDAGVKSVFMGVDFGLSSSVGSDYTVVWTVGLDDNKNRWIIDIQRERGLAYGAQKALVAKVANLYDPGLVYVESNQAQRIFGEELMRETDLPIKLFQTGDQKNSLSNGVPAIRILLENYKFRIPRGDAHSIEMTDIWIHEMTSMTIRNGKVTSLGDHDDTVSACWIAEQAIKNGSFDFSFEEEEGDIAAFDEMMQDMMITPGHPEYLSDDAYVLGAEPPKRGRPRLKNAQLSESPDDILGEDPLYDDRPSKRQGTFPEQGAPMASYFVGKYR
ncbi:MAG: hypothetical protein CME17_01095 [Gemmatimonadetes bacterium]|nr:hypothetical protein [Gemmatimonadota bacterium]